MQEQNEGKRTEARESKKKKPIHVYVNIMHASSRKGGGGTINDRDIRT